LSNSGETEEVLKLLPFVKRLSIPVIALTGRPQSTLAKNSDVVLDVSVTEEACPMGLAPTASTTATLAMGDALAIALLEKRGFKEEDFAQFHPGGTLGRRLLLKVCDVMHHGAAMPRVNGRATVRDAILEMTSKKLGMTTVVDDQGQLVGVITDGDLRRFLEKGINVSTVNAADVASRSPKTIEHDALAARAVQIMEQFSITSLVVLDDRRTLLGIIHLHDLLKSGIV
jgi:arabinose-5-phosphate isomerase